MVLAGLGSVRTPWIAVALAHADRLAGLFEAAFGLADPVAAALRAGLRRAYADRGWDLRTGWDPRTGLAGAPDDGRGRARAPARLARGRAVLAAADHQASRRPGRAPHRDRIASGPG